jgi:hypothetical protein
MICSDLLSSLYSIIAGMPEKAKNRVHGGRITSKECIFVSHHPSPMIDAEDDG